MPVNADSTRVSVQPSRWPQLVGVLLGLSIGSLITFDFLISNYLHLQIQHLHVLRRLPVPTLGPGPSLHHSVHEVPYVLSGVTIFFIIAMGIFFMNVEAIWRRKFKVLLTLVIVSYQTKALLSAGRLDISDVVLLMFLAVWVLHIFMNDDEELAFSPAFFLLLGFYGAMALSAVNGKFPSLVRLTLLGKNLIVFVLLAYYLRNREMFRYFIKVLVVMTAVSSVIGIVQEVLYLRYGILLVGHTNVENRHSFLFLEETSLGTFLRVPGFLGVLPQAYGNTLAVVSTIVFYLILSPELKVFNHRMLLYPIFLLVVTNLILTFSKGVLLGFMSATVLALYLRKPAFFIQISAAFAAILLIGAILAMLKPSILRKAMDRVEAEFSYKEGKIRAELGRLSLAETMRRHQFIGVGVELGKKYTHHYFGWPAHNAFILVLAENGLVGFLLYSALLALILVRLISTLLVVKDDESRSIAKFLLAGFAAIIIHLQFDPFQHLQFIWIYLAAMDGFAGACLRGHHLLPAASAGVLPPWVSRGQRSL
jgi:hypothetical protein